MLVASNTQKDFAWDVKFWSNDFQRLHTKMFWPIDSQKLNTNVLQWSMVKHQNVLVQRFPKVEHQMFCHGLNIKCNALWATLWEKYPYIKIWYDILGGAVPWKPDYINKVNGFVIPKGCTPCRCKGWFSKNKPPTSFGLHAQLVSCLADGIGGWRSFRHR